MRNGADCHRREIWRGDGISGVVESYVLRTPRHLLEESRVAECELRSYRIHGTRLLAVKGLRRGDLIGEYEEDVVSRRVSDLREACYRDAGVNCYIMDVGRGSREMDSDVVVDGAVNGNSMRFLKHSCAPNWVVEEIGHAATILITIFAAKDIGRRAEVTYDYICPG